MGGFWEVVGGGDKGGILVRESLDVASQQYPDRLSTGAVVEEQRTEGDRMHYRLRGGSGPAQGWVSTKIPGKDLLVKLGRLWEVVGGGDKGGIVVRTGLDTASPFLGERLTTGALVQELSLQGLRLNYRRLTGGGPAEGWVSVKLDTGKELLVSLGGEDAGPPPQLPSQAPLPPEREGAPLEVRMVNEEKSFSYEGLDSWVPRAAAVQQAWREKKAFLPTPDLPLARLEGLKLLTPWKKFKPKELREVSKLNLPGCFFDLPFPNTSAQMRSDEYGAEWLTKAFHAAGTLPKENRVAKLLEVKELPVSGFDAAGGAAMKMFLTVEYETPDPELHTELFVKYPYQYEEHPSSRQETSGYSDIDGAECDVSRRLIHSFPFRTPKYYFSDTCRDTTNWILITEKILYGKRGRVENGKIVDQAEFKPYEILPTCGKYQDWLLPNPSEFYMCLFRACGRLAAWDKCGRFDHFLGPHPTYDQATYLRNSSRQAQPVQMKETLKATVSKMMDKGIEFVTRTVKNIASKEMQNIDKLRKMKEELVEMAPYFTDLSGFFQASDSNFIGACHANLQADNAYFWRDEYGDLDCGCLDWGAFGRMPYPGNFLGCLSGASPVDMMEHEEGILQVWVDEHARCGGPKLSLEEVLLRYRLCYITFIYDSCQWIERDILKNVTAEELMAMSGELDPAFQDKFRVRCRTMTVINGFDYYCRRGHYKAIFDKWSKGYGQYYLSEYK
mmetsp:Transcript_95623/g.214081  ORF Transcript_95623/g.214081 Transcript_95623/m.214081 type:complete len:727 (+) Transcript_95623:113-2293(+)